MHTRITLLPNKSALTVLQMISIFYLLLWSVAPPLQMDLIFRVLALGLAFIWFLVEFFRRFEFTYMQIWCALFMAAIAILAFIQSGFSGVISEIAVYMMVLAYFINIYSTDSWLNYRIVVPVTLGLLIFFNIRTANALAQDATIARKLVRDTEELYQYMRQGIGGYGLVYPQVCIAPVVIGWALKSFEHNKLYTALGAVWLVSFWMNVSNAGYSIAIIATIASLLVLLFYRRYSVWPALILAVVIIVAGVLLLVYVEGFRNLVLSIFEGTKVVRKIEDLLSTVEGETADSFATRVTRYAMSLSTCFQFPIIGGKYFGGQAGGHSEILDTFAYYGVWGGIPTLVMIFHTPTSFKNISVSKTVLATSNAQFVVVALVALFDPFVFQHYFPLLILCPIMYSEMMYWNGELYEHSLDGESDPA